MSRTEERERERGNYARCTILVIMVMKKKEIWVMQMEKDEAREKRGDRDRRSGRMRGVKVMKARGRKSERRRKVGYFSRLN